MLKTFFKIAIRNIRKKKAHSFINIAGLAVGMAVAMIIALWIYDELSFNTYHKNYNSIARIMQHTTVNGQVYTSNSQPVPLYEALQTKYPGDFKHVVISSYNQEQIISYKDQFFDENGYYMESGAPEMLSLEIVNGTQNGLNGVNDIMISKSLSDRLFRNEDPIGKVITINKQIAVKVTGVFKDLPKNSAFYNTNFIAPWKLFVASNEWMKQFTKAWEFDVSLIFVEVNKAPDIEKLSKKIQNVINDHLTADQRKTLSDISLHPMSKWHLYEDFKDGINTGGKIQFVWLFGIIGIAVLVLACINFMNLSTARSEQRTKEVGIRKAIGSLRSQLIYQFFSESFVTVIIAFIFSLIILYFNLSWFNAIADKAIVIPWTNPYFWIGSATFIIITGILAGSYPAIYLSSFGVLKALKGSFRVGHMAAMPRYVLVVIQFTVSIVLIIGTIIIYHQVQYSKGRPVGYDQNGLISIKLKTNNIHDHFDVIRNKLTKDGIITDIAESSAPASDYSSNLMGFDWRGKDPNFTDNFNATWVSHEYGKTIDWKVKQGRDFSKERTTDRSGIILNTAAVKYMGLENPVGEIVKYRGNDWTIIGVVEDIVLESPYQVIRPAMFMLSEGPMNVVLFKLNPRISTHEGLGKVQSVFAEYAPGVPLNFQFVDQQYATKFDDEVRISKLSSVFAGLAIFISCLGLFGLASYVTEQRTKEIGIRKVLGASIVNLLALLSKEFVILVFISFLIAAPTAYYFMHNWLQDFQYRATLSWWIFVIAGVGALVITLLTVSIQSIQAALANPVRSLRTE